MAWGTYHLGGFLSALSYLALASFMLMLRRRVKRENASLAPQNISNTMAALLLWLSILITLCGLGHVYDFSPVILGHYPSLWIGATVNFIEGVTCSMASFRLFRCIRLLYASIRALRRLAGPEGYDV